MEDLNSFFAKKDKKKSKGIKFTTVNEIDKKLQVIDNKREKFLNLENEEWKDFEEKKKDYTGLKIQNSITIDAADEEDNGASNISCPWKGVVPKTEDQDEVIIKKSEERLEAMRAPAWSKPTEARVSAYVPPHLRNRSVLSVNPRNIKPNLDNENMFPMLGASSHKTKTSKDVGSKGMGTDLPKHIDNSTRNTSGKYISRASTYHVNKW